MGLHLVMLTGDASAVAKRIGDELGFENVLADLLPQEKMAEIKRLQASGRNVASSASPGRRKGAPSRPETIRLDLAEAPAPFVFRSVFIHAAGRLAGTR